jgi:hypothetical protein
MKYDKKLQIRTTEEVYQKVKDLSELYQLSLSCVGRIILDDVLQRGDLFKIKEFRTGGD